MPCASLARTFRGQPAGGVRLGYLNLTPDLQPVLRETLARSIHERVLLVVRSPWFTQPSPRGFAAQLEVRPSPPLGARDSKRVCPRRKALQNYSNLFLVRGREASLDPSPPSGERAG